MICSSLPSAQLTKKLTIRVCWKTAGSTISPILKNITPTCFFSSVSSLYHHHHGRLCLLARQNVHLLLKTFCLFNIINNQQLTRKTFVFILIFSMLSIHARVTCQLLQNTPCVLISNSTIWHHELSQQSEDLASLAQLLVQLDWAC